MDRKSLIARFEESRNGFLQSIEGLDEAGMLRPAVGDWTVKDILAHLTAWEAETVTALAQLRMGAKPRNSGLPESDLDRLNAKWHGENRGRPLDRVRADFDGVRKQLLRRLEAVSDEDLFTRGRFKWRKGGTLAEWLLIDTADHYDEHAAQIREWRKESQA